MIETTETSAAEAATAAQAGEVGAQEGSSARRPARKKGCGPPGEEGCRQRKLSQRRAAPK